MATGQATATQQTATQQLSYTAKSGRISYSVDLTLTYNVPATNKDGSFDVIGVTGTYAVTRLTGPVNNEKPTTETFNVDKLVRKHHIGNNDNRLFLDGTNTIVNRYGITFHAAATPNAPHPHKHENVNLFYNPQTKTISQFAQGVTAKTDHATTATGGSISSPSTVAAAPLAATCYAAGTRIATERGEVSVEALVIGDRVVTAAGALREVRWLGHRDIDCRRHPCRAAVLPIRIAAHAFGEGRPARDLVVSPGHSICVDLMGETLIPAGALVNGTTIAQIEVARVQYWHVELDSHDIILAENLPAESYLEMGNRAFFAQSGLVALAALPDAKVVTHADFCRPFHADGAVVEAVRARLAARAAAPRRAKAA